MLRVTLLSLFFIYSLPALGAPGDATSAPLACKHCGHWTLYDSDRGLIGESISVSHNKVTIPSFGEFCSEPASVTNTDDGALIKLALGESGNCEANAAKVYSLEIDVRKGSMYAASYAVFNLRRPGNLNPVFTASGWNLAREGPCDDSGSAGLTTCMQSRYADVLKRMTYAAYRAAGAVQEPDATRFARDFNVLRLTQRIKTFCDKQTTGRGGSRWPSYWSVECQQRHIEAKLEELDRWHSCVRSRDAERWQSPPSSARRCTPPSESFDRSLKIPEGG